MSNDQQVTTEEVVSFDDFVSSAEPRLKHAFVARYGRTDGVEATSEALAYAWEHWERISGMDNPVGYLYRVGRSRTRRIRRSTPVLPRVDSTRLPRVEPDLPDVLARLSERQRVAVILVHGLGWRLHEVADLFGISVSSTQNHVERGLEKLRTGLGETT